MNRCLRIDHNRNIHQNYNDDMLSRKKKSKERRKSKDTISTDLFQDKYV